MKFNTSYFIACSILLIFVHCKPSKNDNPKFEYKQISYLVIPVDSMGNLPRNPYILQYKEGDKELLVIGTQHTSDTTNPMYPIIENLFYEFKPDVIINEGGDLTKTYNDKNEAILANQELGLEKYLADKVGIKTINGDEPLKFEYADLVNTYSKEEVFVFLASERFIFPYIFGQYNGSIEEEYDKHFIINYLNKNDIPLTDQEKSFEQYKLLYKKFFNQEFSMDNISQLDFTPFSRRSRFCDVTRSSKEFRDKYLLMQIQKQLEQHQRVMVVYGGWHVLAIEPALYQIINQYKKEK